MATYSTTVQVKSLLHFIPEADTQYDNYIAECRDEAYAEINGKLRGYVTVPYGAAENEYDTIVRIEKLLAAGYFRFDRDDVMDDEDTQAKGTSLLAEGRALLDRFIEEHFLKDKDDITPNINQQRSKKFWET